MPDRVALTGIVFVLKSGIPWRCYPKRWDATASGSTCSGGPTRDRRQAGVWRVLRRVLLDRLRKADEIDWFRMSLDLANVPAKR